MRPTSLPRCKNYLEVIFLRSPGVRLDSPTMNTSKGRVVVLMKEASTENEPFFVADLYSGHRLEDSAYHARAGMLAWMAAIDPAAQPSVAKALDKLTYQVGRPMYSVPLSPAGA